MKNVVQDAYSQYMVEYAFIDDGNMHSSLTLGLVNMYSSVTITTKEINFWATPACCKLLGRHTKG